MADFYDKNLNSNLTFEEVPLETFLGVKSERESALDAIIIKIANNDSTVAAGIKSLLQEELIFHSFERAMTLLLTAKSESHLQRVEAALQITSNEIRNYHAKGSQYITNKKASLYLYTLQNMIFNLDKWKLPNKKYNTFKPNLTQKLQYAKFKCKSLNISEDTIRLECFTNAFQQPYDKNLRNFEFLDENELNLFIKRIQRYETTHNSDDLYKRRPLNEMYSMIETSNPYLDNIISYVEACFGIKKLTLHHYTRNFHTINDAIAKYIGEKDLYKIYNLAESLKDYLSSKEQFNETLHRYDSGRTM